jgi:hypothetical protein
MFLFAVAAAVLAVTVATAVVLSWRHRRNVLARVRSTWGMPRHRVRNMDAIADYHRSLAAAPSASPALDDRTWNDLDMDAVFAALDRAESTLGQQALYHRLRTAPVAAHLEAFDALVVRFAGDTPTRERAQVSLSRLQNPAGYDLWWLAQPDSLERKPWEVIYPIIPTLILASLLAAAVWPVLLLVPIVSAPLNMVIRARTARRVNTVVAVFRQLFALINVAGTLSFLEGSDIDPIVRTLRVETPHLRRLKAMTRWISRDPFAMVEPLASIVELLNLMFLLDVNAVYFGTQEIQIRSASLLRVIAAVGDVDAAISVASFREEHRNWTRPRFRPAGDPITLAEVVHPLVAEPVPNSITLGPPHGVLITGSNMSGKSTFLRTAGVTAVLAQTINTCLARHYEAPALTILSCIGRSDDLIAGKSYYLMEVETVLRLVHASRSTEPHLFLFDELFRGTNAVERIATAEAVLKDLIEDAEGRKRHVVLAATHDGELVDLLKDTYASYHFTDSLGAEGLVFEHRLEPGPARSRNAIALLRLNGAPETIVEEALARAVALDRQRGSPGAA